uniref:Uncharacterized protein n=1 Tax=Ciona savignyi TaxID=51511 RepID=H2ZI61_CIOSA
MFHSHAQHSHVGRNCPINTPLSILNDIRRYPYLSTHRVSF